MTRMLDAGPTVGTEASSHYAVPATPYERSFAHGVRVSHAVAFAYARHALIAILDASGLRPGDEVVLSPLTCKVIPLALLSLELRPVFADISAHTLNLDPQCVVNAIGANTKAILFQHTYGYLAGIEAIATIAANHKLLLVEDCAQCLPLSTHDYRPGNFGDAAIFSNNLGKPLPAGSGGVAVSSNRDLARKVQSRRNALPAPGAGFDFKLRALRTAHRHLLTPGRYWQLFDLYRQVNPSYKVRPTVIEIEEEIRQPATRTSEYQMNTGLAYLRQLELHAAHRRLCCSEYSQALNSVGHLTPIPVDTALPLYYFPVLTRNKPGLLRLARSRRIEVVAWPISTPIYPIERAAELRAYGYAPEACPVAEKIANQLVGLPMRLEATPAARRRVVELVLEIAEDGR